MQSVPANATKTLPTMSPQTTGDLRRLMMNIAMGVMHGEMKATDAVICVKACEQANVSLYSEIKHAALLVELGREVPELGKLPLFGSPVVDAKK